MRESVIAIVIGICLSVILGFGVAKIGWFLGIAALGAAFYPVLIRFPNIAIYFFSLGSFFNGVNVKLPMFVFGLGDLSSLVLVAVWIGHRLFSGTELSLPRGSGWLLSYVIIAFVSLLNGQDPNPSYGGYIRFASRVIALFAFVDLVRSPQTLIGCLYCLVVAGLIHAIVAFAIDPQGGGRLSGLIDQPNKLGSYLSLGLIPLVASLQRHRGLNRRLLIIVGIAFLTVAVILTGSRGVYAGIAAALMWASRHSIQRVILFGLLGLVAVSAASMYSEKRVETIERRLLFQDSSIQKRKNVLKVSKELILKFPLLGIGFGQVGQAYKSISVEEDRGRTTHSFFISVASSIGLPALFVLLMFFWQQVRSLFGGLLLLQGRAEVSENSVWVCQIVSTIMVFHFVSLLVRSSQLYDWSMFTIYASAALLSARAAQDDNIDDADGHSNEDGLSVDGSTGRA